MGRVMNRPACRWMKLWDGAWWAAAILAGSLAWGATKPATRPTTAPAADPDLVVCWRAERADERAAADSSGNGHAAKPAVGSIAIEIVDDRKAFRITPASKGLRADDARDFDFTSDFTVALRVKLAGEKG